MDDIVMKLRKKSKRGFELFRLKNKDLVKRIFEKAFYPSMTHRQTHITNSNAVVALAITEDTG